MPSIARRQFATYTTDFGTEYDNYQFKIRQDKGEVISTYIDAENQVCSGGNLFKPRVIVAEYPDRSTIRYPVNNSTQAAIRQAATEALNDGAVCVHLDGESWAVVPPSILNDAEGNRQAYEIPAGPALKQVGRYDYTSDLLGPVQGRYIFEINPLAVSQAVLSCLANPEEGSFPCAITNLITARSLSIIANNANGGLIVRKTMPETAGADVVTCGENLLAAGFCVRYKGESARNLQVLIPDLNP